MLILSAQRLVVLEVPKTASLALRQMLEPFASTLHADAPRHIGIVGFRREVAEPLARRLAGPVETMAIVREPLERMQSWYRYRLRDQVRRTQISTREVSFAQFMAAYLSDDPPAFARIGRQDRFVGWDGAGAAVDHLFDYAQLDLAVGFLSVRMEKRFDLARRNRSPAGEAVDYSLGDDVLARFRVQNAAEFAMYAAVAGAGHLRRVG